MFSDGLENGFTAWTGTYQSGGSIAVGTTNPHQGINSVKITNSGTGARFAYVYKDLGQAYSTLYARTYAMLDSAPPSTNDYVGFLWIENSATQHPVVAGGLVNLAGILYWELDVYSSSWHTYLSSPLSFQTNNWYSVEIKASAGSSSLYINGQLVVSSPDTPAGPYRYVATGLNEIDGADYHPTGYIDDFTAGANYNGLITVNPTTSSTSFSIIQITDTQHLADMYPQLLDSLSQWIVVNVKNYNVSMVVHTGDIVDYSTSTVDWQNANKSMGKLLNSGVPYCWTAGNHDQNPQQNPNTSWLGNNYAAFNPAIMRAKSYWVSDLYNGKNTAVQFSYGNFKFLIIDVEFYANSSVISWMTNLISTHPDYNVIIGVHSLLSGSGVYTNEGDDGSWETNFVNTLNNYPNVFLTLNGHEHSTNFASRNQVGTRMQIHWDMQEVTNSAGDRVGAASARIYSFDLNKKLINVSTYLVYNSTWLTDSQNSFTFSPTLIQSRVDTVFSDGLENGLNAWTGTYQSGGSIVVGTTSIHQGIYSAKITNSGTSARFAYVYKDLGQAYSTLYARTYAMLDSAPSSTNDYVGVIWIENSATQHPVVAGGLVNIAGVLYWELDVFSSSWHTYLSSPVTFQINNWYSLEIKASAGSSGLFINGQLVVSSPDTPVGPYRYVAFGLNEVDGAYYHPIGYVDDFAAGANYIL